MSFCLYWHGKPFKEAWTLLLLKLGYSHATIRGLDESKPFYRNIFIIRPNALKKLTAFMERAMTVAETDPAVKALLEKDAKYKEVNHIALIFIIFVVLLIFSGTRRSCATGVQHEILSAPSFYL